MRYLLLIILFLSSYSFANYPTTCSTFGQGANITSCNIGEFVKIDAYGTPNGGACVGNCNCGENKVIHNGSGWECEEPPPPPCGGIQVRNIYGECVDPCSDGTTPHPEFGCPECPSGQIYDYSTHACHEDPCGDQSFACCDSNSPPAGCPNPNPPCDDIFDPDCSPDPDPECPSGQVKNEFGQCVNTPDDPEPDPDDPDDPDDPNDPDSSDGSDNPDSNPDPDEDPDPDSNPDDPDTNDGSDGGSGNDSGEEIERKENKVSGGFTCQSEPICEGDQALCAILKQEWFIRCAGYNNGIEEGSFDMESTNNARSEAEAKLSQTIDNIQNEIASTFDFNLSSGGGGLIDFNAETKWGNVPVGFSKHSDELSKIGLIFLAIAYVTALLIILR